MGLGEAPCLDLSSMDEKSEGEWEGMCMEARALCEDHGFFVITGYEKIPSCLGEETFMALKTLFDLPEDTKKKYQTPRPYSSYSNKSPVLPLLESFGIDDAPEFDSARAFTDLLWPHGNPTFCKTIISMSSKMLELSLMILRMIMDGYGLEKKLYDSLAKNLMSNFRLMKYSAPPRNQDSTVGLVPHTDKNMLTLLCSDSVQGLEFLSRHGEWNKLMLPRGSFVAIVADTFQAWSNGRLRAASHRVILSGQKDRYSCGLFIVPKKGVTTEVPEQLVDDDHPLLYHPFVYDEYLNYYLSNRDEHSIETFAAVTPNCDGDDQLKKATN